MKKILFALILFVYVGSTFTTNAYATTTINSIVTIQDSQDDSMMQASPDEASAGFTQELKTVSYTHLTLPTIYSV